MGPVHFGAEIIKEDHSVKYCQGLVSTTQQPSPIGRMISIVLKTSNLKSVHKSKDSEPLEGSPFFTLCYYRADLLRVFVLVL